MKVLRLALVSVCASLGLLVSPAALAATARSLPAPTITSAAASGLQYIDAAWTPVAKATRYEVRYTTARHGGWSETVSTTATSATLGPGYPGDTFVIEVRALSTSLTSLWSGAVTAHTPPAAPSSPFLTAIRPDLVELSWQPGDGAEAYEVHSVNADGSQALVQPVQALGDTQVRVAAVADTAYTFVVSSIGPGGLRSEASIPSSLTTPSRWQATIYLGPVDPVVEGDTTFTVELGGHGDEAAPSGVVALSVDDGTPVELTLADGRASTTVSLGAGTHRVVASYSGDSAFEPTTSALSVQAYPAVPPMTAVVLDQPVGTSTDAAVGDVDGDAATDLVSLVVGESASELHVRLGRGDGTFADPLRRSLPAGCATVSVGRLDIDAFEDAVVGCPDGLRVLAGSDTGVGSPTSVRVDGVPTDVLVAELTGDGLEDVAYGTTADLRVVPSAGRLRFGRAQAVASGFAVTDLQAADVNGDGRLDLAGTTEVDMGPREASVWAATGTGWVEHYRTQSGQADLGTFADATGDGRADLTVLYYDLSSTETVTLLVSEGDGTMTPRVVPSDGLWTSATAVGDVDGDGEPELVAAPSSTSQLSVWQLGDPVSLRTPVELGAAYSATAAAADDLNGDGRADIVMVDPGIGLVLLLST
jgi:hypothetical protein